MSVNQIKEKRRSGREFRKTSVPSKWSHVAAVSAVLWTLLSLPLLVMFGRVVDLLSAHQIAFTFLFLRSARSRRIAAICLRCSVLVMATLIVMGIAMMKEGERMGGDTGKLQVIMASLIDVVLPTLIIMPGMLGLISLWPLKGTIPADYIEQGISRIRIIFAVRKVKDTRVSRPNIDLSFFRLTLLLKGGK